MTEEAGQVRCHCECGANQFALRGAPLLRAICHCRICQEFNQADYADVLIYRRSQLTFPDDGNVEFRAYKQPPLVRRGRCNSCSRPVLEYLQAPLLPALTIVPAAIHGEPATLPQPGMHMYYHRRVADIDDALPKYSGALRSQFGFMRYLLPALRRH